MSRYEIEGRAPSKVIIAGEHFVVKGEPAVAAALNLMSSAKIREIKEDRIIIKSENLGVIANLNLKLKGKCPPELKPFVRILELLREEAGILRSCYILLNSEIPMGSGLGSSASTAAAFTVAYSKYIGLELQHEELSRIVFEAEKIVHVNPSGIDNTVVTYGGVIAYRKGEGFIRLSVKIDPRYIWLIADTGISRSTGKLVQKVLNLYKRYESTLMPLYHAAGHLAIELARALEEGNYEKVGELMNINHGFLVSIGVSNLRIEQIIHKAIDAGAIGAKITGAGGGGCVLILVGRDKAEKVIKAIVPHTKHIMKASIAVQGAHYILLHD